MDDNFLDNLFSPEEYQIYNNISIDAVNIKELEKYGKVTEKEVTEDGIVMKFLHFKSWDGLIEFTKVKSYPIEQDKYEKVKELNDKIAFAILTEDYEKAQALKQEKEQLLLKSE